MGILFNLLTLPVTGPVKATAWIAEQVLAAAEQEYYDEQGIRRRMAEAEARHQAGELSDEEYETGMDALLERLLEVREMQAGSQQPHEEGGEARG